MPWAFCFMLGAPLCRTSREPIIIWSRTIQSRDKQTPSEAAPAPTLLESVTLRKPPRDGLLAQWKSSIGWTVIAANLTGELHRPRCRLFAITLRQGWRVDRHHKRAELARIMKVSTSKFFIAKSRRAPFSARPLFFSQWADAIGA